MTPDDSTSGPVIDRAALERVLARATELQATSTDAPEGISESRLVEIGREVGISAEHLRLALAEERSRLPYEETEQGPVLNALGVSAVSAQRAINGAPGELLATIDTWMKREEMMETRRRATDRISWQPRNDKLGHMFRAIGSGGRKLELMRADQIAASVTAVDSTRTVVRFDAELNRMRRAQRTLAFVLALGLNGVVFMALAVPLLFLALGTPAGAFAWGAMAVLAAGQSLAGFAIWRGLKNAYRRTVSRMQLQLERLLDELEHGGLAPRPTLIGQLRDAMLEATTPLRGVLPPRDV